MVGFISTIFVYYSALLSETFSISNDFLYYSIISFASSSSGFNPDTAILNLAIL